MVLLPPALLERGLDAGYFLFDINFIGEDASKRMKGISERFRPVPREAISVIASRSGASRQKPRKEVTGTLKVSVGPRDRQHELHDQPVIEPFPQKLSIDFLWTHDRSCQSLAQNFQSSFTRGIHRPKRRENSEQIQRPELIHDLFQAFRDSLDNGAARCLKPPRTIL